jgi:predicted DNA-binding transcriptional regulator AlpA
VNRPNIVETRYLTANEAAVFLGVAVGTLRNWASRGKFEADPVPTTKFSTRCLRFLQSDLEAWAKRRGMNRTVTALSQGPIF